MNFGIFFYKYFVVNISRLMSFVYWIIVRAILNEDSVKHTARRLEKVVKEVKIFDLHVLVYCPTSLCEKFDTSCAVIESSIF